MAMSLEQYDQFEKLLEESITAKNWEQYAIDNPHDPNPPIPPRPHVEAKALARTQLAECIAAEIS